MFKGLATALLLAAASVAQNSTMVINTPPSIVVCQPAQITWTGGTAPYYVNVLPGGEPSGTPIESLVVAGNENSYTWNVNLPANTKITLSLKDASGQVVYSGTSTIQGGTDTSCVNSSLSVGGGGGASNTGAAGATGGADSSNTGGAGAASTTGGAAAATSAAATDKSSASGSAAASASSAKSAGMALNVPVALTVVGAAVAALL